MELTLINKEITEARMFRNRNIIRRLGIDDVANFELPLAKADIEKVMQGLETVLAVSSKGKLTSVRSRIKIAD